MRYLIALCILWSASTVQAGLFFGPNIRTTQVYYGAAPAVAVYDAYPTVMVSAEGQTHKQRHHANLAAKFQAKANKHAAKAAQ